jgi:hypothetical protein
MRSRFSSTTWKGGTKSRGRSVGRPSGSTRSRTSSCTETPGTELGFSWISGAGQNRPRPYTRPRNRSAVSPSILSDYRACTRALSESAECPLNFEPKVRHRRYPGPYRQGEGPQRSPGASQGISARWKQSARWTRAGPPAARPRPRPAQAAGSATGAASSRCRGATAPARPGDVQSWITKRPIRPPIAMTRPCSRIPARAVAAAWSSS